MRPARRVVPEMPSMPAAHVRPLRGARLRVRTAAAAGLAAAATLVPRAASARRTWPTRPVKLVVTYPPGGTSDTIARLVAPLLADAFGQPFVVEHHAGGGGTLGAAAVAASAPDGHTLMVSSVAPLAIAPAMVERPPYDPARGFVHIGLVGRVPNVFVVHPSVPVGTMADLQAWLRQLPEPTGYGSGGMASIGHVVGETYARLTAARLQHVAYRGSGPMRMDLVAGTIGLAVDTLPPSLDCIATGRLRGLAVTGPERVPLLPGLPTVAELGMPSLTSENFIGLSGPADVPQPVVRAVHDTLLALSSSHALRSALDAASIAAAPMSQPEFAAFVAREVRDWAPRVKAARLRMQ
jgi:tripartite-type tricarboxylate transporter receptor subunit TctC